MMKSKMSTPTRNSSASKKILKPRVIGIDPGFDRFGIAVVEGNEVLFSDCIETNRKSAHEERLAQIGRSLRDVIEKWRPTSLAVEKLFFNQNANNALKVAEARGLALYEAGLSGIKVFEYSPQDVKIAVTGYGKADKKQVEMMVLKLVKMKTSRDKRLDDELDAIAVCITCLASEKNF